MSVFNPGQEKIFTIIVFLVAYLFILSVRKKHPVVFVWPAALLLVIFGCLSPGKALGSINVTVLGVFLGMMILSSLFIASQVPAFLADRVLARSRSVGMAFLGVCGLSSVISVFCDNVATVLMVAPIGLEIARRLRINPIQFLIGIAIASNLQGTALMIGDSPSIIMSIEMKMSFNDFIWMKGRPGIAFAVQIGAVVSFLVLYFFYRKYRQPLPEVSPVKVESWVPTILLALVVITLVCASFVENRPEQTPGLVCFFYAIVGLVWYSARKRQSLSVLRELDWKTFGFLIGIFVLVGSLTTQGVVQDVANWIQRVSQGNALSSYCLIIFISVFVSAFVDNIPYTIAMIPVAKSVADSLGLSPELFVFALLVGTCVGGNITPVGASACIVTAGLLRKNGYPVTVWGFAKVGLPFTLAAVGAAVVFLWFVWR